MNRSNLKYINPINHKKNEYYEQVNMFHSNKDRENHRNNTISENSNPTDARNSSYIEKRRKFLEMQNMNNPTNQLQYLNNDVNRYTRKSLESRLFHENENNLKDNNQKSKIKDHSKKRLEARLYHQEVPKMQSQVRSYSNSSPDFGGKALSRQEKYRLELDAQMREKERRRQNSITRKGKQTINNGNGGFIFDTLSNNNRKTNNKNRIEYRQQLDFQIQNKNVWNSKYPNESFRPVERHNRSVNNIHESMRTNKMEYDNNNNNNLSEMKGESFLPKIGRENRSRYENEMYRREMLGQMNMKKRIREDQLKKNREIYQHKHHSEQDIYSSGNYNFQNKNRRNQYQDYYNGNKQVPYKDDSMSGEKEYYGKEEMFYDDIPKFNNKTVGRTRSREEFNQERREYDKIQNGYGSFEIRNGEEYEHNQTNIPRSFSNDRKGYIQNNDRMNGNNTKINRSSGFPPINRNAKQNDDVVYTLGTGFKTEKKRSFGIGGFLQSNISAREKERVKRNLEYAAELRKQREEVKRRKERKRKEKQIRELEEEKRIKQYYKMVEKRELHQNRGMKRSGLGNTKPSSSSTESYLETMKSANPTTTSNSYQIDRSGGVGIGRVDEQEKTRNNNNPGVDNNGFLVGRGIVLSDPSEVERRKIEAEKSRRLKEELDRQRKEKEERKKMQIKMEKERELADERRIQKEIEEERRKLREEEEKKHQKEEEIKRIEERKAKVLEESRKQAEEAKRKKNRRHIEKASVKTSPEIVKVNPRLNNNSNKKKKK